MSAATTIVFAREDLSIPGAAEAGMSGRDRPETVQTRFFDLISRSCPDVIVLDLSRDRGYRHDPHCKASDRNSNPGGVQSRATADRRLPHRGCCGLYYGAGRHRQFEPDDTTDR